MNSGAAFRPTIDKMPHTVKQIPVLQPTRHAFYDWSQSMALAWDIWFATHAAARHIAELADIRLRELVALARQHSRFYQRLYRGVPEDEYRLTRLPVVKKADLMAHFDQVVTDRAVSRAAIDRFLADARCIGRPFLDQYAVWTSSGTTGDPGVFLHDGHALAVYDAVEALRSRQFDSPALLPLAFLPGDRYAFVGATGGHFAGTASFERLRWLNPWIHERARVFSILDPMPTLARALNEYQPTLLATYPTVASLLAEEQRAGRLAIRPREILMGGEALSSGQRARITSAFGCRVRNDYGASEFLAIAWECAHGALHINADWVILEPVDEHYRPVPAGVASHSVLVTNLANRVQPLIRYDLGDSVTLLEQPCQCGSALPAIRVVGRCDDILALRDAAGRTVRLLPLAVTTVVEEDAAVYRFQLVQMDAARLVLRLDSTTADAEAAERCQNALRRYLHRQGLANVRIDVEQCAPQRNPVSGKLQRVVARERP